MTEMLMAPGPPGPVEEWRKLMEKASQDGVKALQDTGDFIGLHWIVLFPLFLAILTPVLEAGIQVVYDYFKTKGWLR